MVACALFDHLGHADNNLKPSSSLTMAHYNFGSPRDALGLTSAANGPLPSYAFVKG